MADPRQARALIDEVETLGHACAAVGALPLSIAEAIRSKISLIRRNAAEAHLSEIPVRRLRDAAKGIKIDALERAGFTTVASVSNATPAQLMMIPGVGEVTATQAIAAARQALAVAESSEQLQFDVELRSEEQGELLDLLRQYDLARRAADEARPMSEWFQSTSQPLVIAARPASESWLRRAFTASQKKNDAQQALVNIEQLMMLGNVRRLREHLDAATAEIVSTPPAFEIWRHYENNAAVLNGILHEFIAAPDHIANQGYLTKEIVASVTAMSLDQQFLKASLRGYQAFGAKYALVQRRVILGDEMGLGKTIEALAALCHLRAEGKDRALVVCPASVVANWRSEILRHTTLDVHVLHGPDKDFHQQQWQDKGGIAVTTYEGLHRISIPAAPASSEPSDNANETPYPIAMLVVDEAHYVKNPQAQRTKAVAKWAKSSERVLLMTGTPMENRLEEFQSLLSLVQPEVAALVDETTAMAGPAAFQSAVAPAYLRRNQSDVLEELPEKISSLDWVEATDKDLVAYREAVADGGFMKMRRAAFASIAKEGPFNLGEADDSAKLARLLDIVEEATQEGLKVVVFSFFRDVLRVASKALTLAMPTAVYGPLTGDTPVDERQRTIDLLSAHQGGAVLLAQIDVGGTGLNIQAASVVVLCEPQWKPTTEDQAIARCHRMGQVRRVQVHRLLLTDSVDQRMLEILAGKQQLIDAFMRDSAIKDASAEAVDVSDLEA
ncbi:MAG: DEAD/DEAH box helicase, partial [Acidimicrobiales bacterium]|nr:DEAD/DEAH box helicase [Acidimicrobiales bacterium]